MKREDLDKSVKTVIIISTLLIGSYAFWFVVINKQPLSLSSSDWGSFGDFVGGILNPFIAFSALYWLVKSVNIQKQELGDTRKALEASKDAQQELAMVEKYKMKLSINNMRFQAKLSEINAQRTILEEEQRLFYDSMNAYRAEEMAKFGKYSPLHLFENFEEIGFLGTGETSKKMSKARQKIFEARSLFDNSKKELEIIIIESEKLANEAQSATKETAPEQENV